MAWRCGGATNDELVNNLKKSGIITKDAVEKAMKAVDRSHYSKRSSYDDSPQTIGYNATISAPHMHAHALEHLNIKKGFNILDVGSGSGYLTACIAHMVGEKGKVTGIEHIEELIEKSIKNVNNDPISKELMKKGQIEFITGDGRDGYEKNAPYDAIHVGAAAADIPAELIKQLKVGGRLIIPVGEENCHQSLDQIDKVDESGKITRKELMGVIYVPLTSHKHQTER